jgi:predicted DNA-binding transcriptional regulator YafY
MRFVICEMISDRFQSMRWKVLSSWTRPPFLLSGKHWLKSWIRGTVYSLEVPYADDRELLQDILRQGREVEVLSPASLRQKVGQEATAIAAVYSGE